ncbi:MAG: polyprenyl diphosphate synthase [Patescibacteria group bacterium]
MSSLNHIAIIVDGNRRWAKAQNLPTLEGHLAGYKKVKEFARFIFKRGIPWASFYLFSKENWKRKEAEVGYLFNLLETGLKNEIDEFVRDGIRLHFVGEREELRESLQKLIAEAEEKTKNGTKGNFVACINYGGSQAILEAVKKLSSGGIDLSKITSDDLKQAMTTRNLPPVDLMIRTSGEQRISNFLLWELLYAELYFTPTLFPDLSEEEFDKILAWYAIRERRFGK